MDFFGKNFNNVFALPFYLAISSGEIKNFDCIDKFWEAPALQTTDTDVEIREQQEKYTFSADGVADIDTLSSDNVSDTAILIKVSGLSADGSAIDWYANLNGTTKVLIYGTIAEALAQSGTNISFWRVHRLENISGEEDGTTAKNITGNVYCYVDDTTVTTPGVPDDTTNIRAKIIDGNNQTQMAIYTIPKGKTGYLIQGDMSMSRPTSSTSTAVLHYESRRFGWVFKIKKTIGLISAGTSYFKDIRSVPDIIPPLTDLVILNRLVSANNVWISASFQIILVDDPRFS